MSVVRSLVIFAVLVVLLGTFMTALVQSVTAPPTSFTKGYGTQASLIVNTQAKLY